MPLNHLVAPALNQGEFSVPVQPLAPARTDPLLQALIPNRFLVSSTTPHNGNYSLCNVQARVRHTSDTCHDCV